jgi:hypothetical protein
VVTDDARWFAGIDWSSQTHQACLIDAGDKIIGERAFAHGGAGLAELCAWLLTMTAAEPAAIAVVSRSTRSTRSSSIASVWLGPRTTGAMRMSFPILCAPTRLTAEDAVVVELREWSRMTEDLQQESNRLANRMREQLWRYYPQALTVCDDLGC